MILNTLGVYSIMCECGEVYTGRTVHYIKTSVFSTNVTSNYGTWKKTAIEEYSNDLSYWILLSNTNILAKKFKHRDQIKRGKAAINIYRQQHNQKKWFHTAQITEAAHPLNEVLKEVSFQEQAWHHRQTTANQRIVWKMESVNMLMFSWDKTLVEASKYASSSAFHFKPAVTPEWDVCSLPTFLSTLVLKRFVFSQFHIPHLTELFYTLKLGHLLTINFPLCSTLERVNPSQFPCYDPYCPGLRFYLLPTSHEFEYAPFVESSNIIWPHPHPTHFNQEDGGSMFLQKTHIHR